MKTVWLARFIDITHGFGTADRWVAEWHKGQQSCR